MNWRNRSLNYFERLWYLGFEVCFTNAKSQKVNVYLTMTDTVGRLLFWFDKTALPFKRLWVLDFYGKTKKRQAIIRNNRNYLENNIQINDDIFAALLYLNCITEEQSHFIQRKRSARDKNDELLNVVETFDETSYLNFVNCLRETNQKTLAKITENGGGLNHRLGLS